ncbi:cilia- and flagella-associated protein 337-like [Neosynchiropus ocellatus]
MEVAQLESRMNTEDYETLKNLFLTTSGETRSFCRAEFIDQALTNVSCCSREEFGHLFDRVVMENSGVPLELDAAVDQRRIDWTQLRSFLQMELSEKLNTSQVSAVPRWKPPRTLTCPRRDPIHKVLNMQSSGQYMTVSKGGTIGIRASADWSLLHTHQLVNCTVRPKDIWVTDLVLMHNINQGLKYTPWCLDYWADPSHPNQAFLTVGDTGGQVTLAHFTSAQMYLFDKLTHQTDLDSAHVITWDELIKGKHRSCSTFVHQAHKTGWVRKVLYLSSLKAFASCSTTPQSSLVIGWRGKENKNIRVTSFATKRGVWDVDYHPETNLLATAGVDHQVVLWNPYITSQPVCVFSSHTSPVTAVRFMQSRKQLLSFSKDKVLCVWDLSNQLCVKRLAGVLPRTLEDPHTLLFFFEEQETVLFTFNSTLVLLEALQEEQRTSSHESPVTCVLYNSLLRQVVSGDSSSRVICWLTDTGQKVRQIPRCHGNASISAMTLDHTQTRLFTAGSNGEVKLWNFRGHCLCRVNAASGRVSEISQILLLKRSVLVMGWGRMLTAFQLHSLSQPMVEPSEWKGDGQHGEVLCAAFQPPHTLITGGADSVSCGGSGVVRLWNTLHNCLMGQFTAHDPELGSIVMAVSPCGKYLVTADREGNCKMWDIEEYILPAPLHSTCGCTPDSLVSGDFDSSVNDDYCFNKEEGGATKAPKLLQTSKLHLDRITHLEICVHGDRLFLLSASSDGNVALSSLPGGAVGFFGQEEPWCLKGPAGLHPQQESQQVR